MSDLRKQIQSSREEHRSVRYPGNLAEELLARPRYSVMRIFAVTGAVSGIAAAILVFLFWHSAPSAKTQATDTVAMKPATPAPVATTAPADEDVVPMTTLASLPSFP